MWFGCDASEKNLKFYRLEQSKWVLSELRELVQEGTKNWSQKTIDEKYVVYESFTFEGCESRFFCY